MNRMNILVNGLSVGSLSGEHVLYGHLEQLANKSSGDHRFHVVYHGKRPTQDRAWPDNVIWHEAPASLKNWWKRLTWERFRLPKLITEWGCERLFTPAGLLTAGCNIPQVCLAQNPWAFHPTLHNSRSDRFKALLQRRAYRKAFANAEVMVFNSKHMEDLYSGLGSNRVNPSHIVYQGINEATFEAAQKSFTRKELTILSVSVMAKWKGVVPLVKSIGLLHKQKIPARLELVGPWPDAHYRSEVEETIRQEKLGSHVEITGRVSDEELQQRYGQAKVYALLSRCESFGIPAVEAQAFGTPVLGATGSAMSEIGGAGGHYVSPDSVEDAANYLSTMLTDSNAWQNKSSAAKTNAARFHWSQCSEKLVEIFAA